MQEIAISHRLLATTLVACLVLSGCKPLSLRKKPAEPAAQADEEKTTKKSPFDWINKLRDDRALEVERHLGS
jgi:hypothetical protein